MKWPWSRERSTVRSEEVERAERAADIQLREARQLRAEAKQVGTSLAESRDANHYAMALAAVFSKGPNR